MARAYLVNYLDSGLASIFGVLCIYGRDSYCEMLEMHLFHHAWYLYNSCSGIISRPHFQMTLSCAYAVQPDRLEWLMTSCFSQNKMEDGDDHDNVNKNQDQKIN